MWGAANVAGYAGTVYTLLERPGPARAALQKALAELEPSAVKRRSICLVNLSMTYAQELEVEAACELARKALDVAGPMFSGTTVERMAGLRHRLARWQSVRAVRELDDRLHALGASV